MAQIYSLIFVNNSVNRASACVYQKDPDIGVNNVMSLAWFSKVAHPATQLTFEWSIDYSFVWSETGTLAPGVKFMASQVLPADLTGNNSVTFTKDGGAYTFTNQKSGTSGSLIITDDGTIPSKQASIGVGMSGSGTFAVQAQPNLTTTFTPHPEYWITFGTYEKGDVLDVQSITSAAQIAFPPNVYSMTAILNEDNTWTVMSTSEANARHLRSKALNRNALWGASASLEEAQAPMAAALSR